MTGSPICTFWRLGPGHLGAIISMVSDNPQPPQTYKRRLAHFRNCRTWQWRWNPELAIMQRGLRETWRGRTRVRRVA